MSDTKRRALILKDFTDAGTGESFTKDSTPLVEHGAFANYEAAGLAGKVPTTPAPRAKPAAQPRKRNAKPASAPATDPAPATPIKADDPTA